VCVCVCVWVCVRGVSVTHCFTLTSSSHLQLCVHPRVSVAPEASQNAMCRTLMRGRKCMYKNGLDKFLEVRFSCAPIAQIPAACKPFCLPLPHLSPAGRWFYRDAYARRAGASHRIIAPPHSLRLWASSSTKPASCGQPAGRRRRQRRPAGGSRPSQATQQQQQQRWRNAGPFEPCSAERRQQQRTPWRGRRLLCEHRA
jgi:hypothetical protein